MCNTDSDVHFVPFIDPHYYISIKYSPFSPHFPSLNIWSLSLQTFCAHIVWMLNFNTSKRASLVCRLVVKYYNAFVILKFLRFCHSCYCDLYDVYYTLGPGLHNAALVFIYLFWVVPK